MAFNPKIIEGGKGEGKGSPSSDNSANLSIAFADTLASMGFRVEISESEERADPSAKMKDGRLARWDSDHWRILDGVGAKEISLGFAETAERSGSIVEIASRFSAESDSRKHSPDRAATLASAARLDLPSVPAAPDFSVIPTRGAWLRPILPEEPGVPDEWRGKILVIPPDPALGVFHRLPVALEVSQGAPFYAPTPIPAGSLLSRFLESSLPDLGSRQAVQEFVGYSLLTHGPNLQVFQIWLGGGGNGKGEMQKLASGLHRSAFVYKPNSKSDFSLEGIEKASLILADEWPKRIEGIEELKSIIGDGLIKINRKGKSLYDARVRGKMIVNSNHSPIWPEVNDAIDRRVQMISWSQKPAEVIDNLAEKILRDEFKSLLDWALEGLIRLMNRRSARRPNGFSFEPLALSEDLKKQSRVESDSVLRWLNEEEAFISRYEGYAMKREVFQAYEHWASETGTKSPCGEVEFWKRISRALPDLKSWRQRQGQDRFHVSNLVLPKHSPEEARIREGEAPESCPFAPAPAVPGEAEKAALQRWKEANPQGAEGSYRPEWDALLPHAKALFREAVAEGVGREGIAARMAAKIRLLGGCPPAGMEAARHGFVETLLD